MPIMMIHDLPNPDDPQRRSYKECNADLRHTIPIGTLVEQLPYEYDDEPSNAGMRLFVARHDRDCDQTPLYALGLWSNEADRAAPRGADGLPPVVRVLKVLLTGFSDDSLRVVSGTGPGQPDPARCTPTSRLEYA